MNEGNQKRLHETAFQSGLGDAYRPLPGVADEMIDASGAMRPGWQKLIGSLERLGREELESRFMRASQYLNDAGVYYRVYDTGGTHEREWPLAHVPLVIHEKEWASLSAGLVQRADLLEEIVADIYGENRLVRDGLLPPDLIAANPEFLRPMVGIKPVGGHFLHFCSFELGRGPNGQWWVLGDRTQAPSGQGFALENRVATTRALSDIYGGMNVYRLAGFFRQFRDALLSRITDPEARAAILTPGPLNETYFEHAYIARYLGIMLLEGEDLTVANGQVMVRTVSGLKPISVLWRRMDAAFIDPLEFNYSSRIGTPGFVDALRQQAVSVVNAVGAGIVETRALLAFLPGISQAVHGRNLALPSIATWWCGQTAERDHVIANLDRMMVGSALSTRLPFEDQGQTVLGSLLDGEDRSALIARISAEGRHLVGQEAVTLSTTPVYVDGRLEPRPVSLRVYAARTENGWTIMPGGFARVGYSLDSTAITMQRGGQAADVWIVSDNPVDTETLLPRNDNNFNRMVSGSLPSRAAENLMWLGRYTERAEGTARILRAYHARLAEASTPDLPLLEAVREYLDGLGVDAESAIPQGFLQMIDGAKLSAGRIRDRFSPDGWSALNDLSKTIHRFDGLVKPGDDAARAMTVALRKLAGFSGLVHENMYRFTGWRFLEIGRRIERGIQISRLLGRFTREDAPDGSLDLVLEVGDSVMTHRRRYNVYSNRTTVNDLLALDPLNPRAVLFQLAALKDEIGLLPNSSEGTQLAQVAKDVLQLHTALAVQEPAELSPEKLDTLAWDIGNLSNTISRKYFA